MVSKLNYVSHRLSAVCFVIPLDKGMHCALHLAHEKIFSPKSAVAGKDAPTLRRFVHNIHEAPEIPDSFTNFQ